MFENFSVPSGFEVVTNVTNLEGSGTRSLNLFFADDKITVSDRIFSQMRPSSQKDVNGNPVSKPVYYVLCNVTPKGATNGVDRLISLSTFRRIPRDAAAFLESSTALMRTLASCSSDAERFDLLKGKTLRVTTLKEGEALDFLNSNFATREFVYKKSKFAVFDFAN